ncbi:MAG: NUDIX hydrolase [Deltaproteobacteria bacterium]|nr:NUDIX hydrolase [Deltaproteobacteria bacterium]
MLFRLWRILARIPGLEGFLLHVINARFIVGVSGVILDGENRVLLFHHTYRRRYAWGLPGGWMRAGEDARVALTREVAEESGLAVNVLAPIAVETVRRRTIIEMIYLARLTGGQFLPSAEVDAIRLVEGDIDEPIKPVQRRAIAEVRRLAAEGKLPERIDV